MIFTCSPQSRPVHILVASTFSFYPHFRILGRIVLQFRCRFRYTKNHSQHRRRFSYTKFSCNHHAVLDASKSIRIVDEGLGTSKSFRTNYFALRVFAPRPSAIMRAPVGRAQLVYIQKVSNSSNMNKFCSFVPFLFQLSSGK